MRRNKTRIITDSVKQKCGECCSGPSPATSDMFGSLRQLLVPKTMPYVKGIEIGLIKTNQCMQNYSMCEVMIARDGNVSFCLFYFSGTGWPCISLGFFAQTIFVTRENDDPQLLLRKIVDQIEQIASNRIAVSGCVGFLDLQSNKVIYSCVGSITCALFDPKKSLIKKCIHTWPSLDINEVFLQPEEWIVFGRKSLITRLKSYQLFTRPEALTLCETKNKQDDFILETVPDSVNTHSQDVCGLFIDVRSESRLTQLKQQLGFVPHDPVYIQTCSYFEQIDTIASHILKDMDDAGFSDDAIRRMKLTITELVANAIEHGNKNDHAKKVTIGHTIKTSAIVVSILDEGCGFDPKKIPDPTLPEHITKDHGRGLFIVRNYIDSIEFNSTGNRVTIVKNRQPKQ